MSATRALGLWMSTALVVGNVIGIGIFVMPASLAPYGLNAIVGWLITVLGCGMIAISFASLARTFPQDDGPYTYTQRVFGEATAFIVMWCYWVSTWVTNAAIAIGLVGYLSVFIPVLTQHRWLPAVTGVGLLWLFVVVNMRGARTAGWFQVLTTVLKLLPLVGAIGLGLWVLWVHPTAYTEHVPANPISIGGLSSACTIALFAMLGIECATIPAGRVKDPERTIPRATVLGTIVTALICLGVSVVPVLLIPQPQLVASNAPFADLFARVLGADASKVIALFVIISGLGALNGWTLMIGEITQGVARHGRLPRLLTQENAHGAPVRALVVTAAVSSLMLLANYSESIASGFAFLTVVVTAANLPLYFACTLALVVLGARGKLRASRVQLWFLSASALLACAYCAWASIGIGARPLLWTLVLGAVGAPVYWASMPRWRGAAHVTAPRPVQEIGNAGE
ncbi:MAG: amino acid permease [Sinobacteraceae bacterium]|nr:amino acid permease [Nevskiaceae bacterium]